MEGATELAPARASGRCGRGCVSASYSRTGLRVTGICCGKEGRRGGVESYALGAPSETMDWTTCDIRDLARGPGSHPISSLLRIPWPLSPPCPAAPYLCLWGFRRGHPVCGECFVRVCRCPGVHTYTLCRCIMFHWPTMNWVSKQISQ